MYYYLSYRDLNFVQPRGTWVVPIQFIMFAEMFNPDCISILALRHSQPIDFTVPWW